MSNRPSLDDYVDVAERIQNFKDTNPDGSLQTISWEVREVDGKTFIVYHAAAYRTPDDPRPGHGISWEPFPGQTPYTKQSELMNAETAAWGRAIIATGEASKGSLASRQEVRNRRAEQDAEAENDSKPVSRSKPRKQPVALAEPAEARSVAENGSQGKPVDPAVLKQLRETFIASGHTDNDLCFMLISVGVESLPGNPTKEDIGNAMRGLTLEQAFKVEALLKGEDDTQPGSGEVHNA